MTLMTRITERPGGAYRAVCPALPGCWVVGRTRNEARAKIAEAVEGYLASLDVTLPRELGRLLAEQRAAAA